MQRVVACLGIVDRHAVEQHEHLIEGATAHRQINLGVVRAAAAYIQTGQVLQHVGYGTYGQSGDLLAGDSGNNAVRVGLKFSLIGNHQHFLNTKLPVGGGFVGLFESKSLRSNQRGNHEQRRLACLEQLQVGYRRLDTADSHLAMHRAESSISLAGQTPEAQTLTNK